MIGLSLGPAEASVSIVRDGKQYVQPVSSKILIDLLSTHGGVSTGLLPANTRYYYKSGECYSVAIEFPATKRTLLVKHDYESQVFTIKDVPLPAGVLFVRLQQAVDGLKLVSLGLWATDSNGIQGVDTKLYTYPAPNVEFTGRVCWGTNQSIIEGIKKISAAEGLVRRFFGTHFNDHLFYTNMLSPQFPWGTLANNHKRVELYFQKLVELGAFQDSWLTQANGYGYTFESAVKKLFVEGRAYAN